MRQLAFVTVVLSIAANACADPSALTRPDPSTLDEASFARPVTSSPVIDGVIRSGEYAGAAVVTFDATLPDGRRTPVTIRVTHDDRYLYAAATFSRFEPFHPADRIILEFDNDNDGLRENGDDIIAVVSAGAPYTAVLGNDFYRFNGGAANAADIIDGGTTDVLQAWGTTSTNVGTFEVRHDLNSADDRHDISIDPSRRAQTVGVQFDVLVEANPVGSGANTHTFYPSFFSYCQLTIGKKSTSIDCP